MPAILLFLVLLHIPSGTLTAWAAASTGTPEEPLGGVPTTDIHLGWDPNG